MFVGLFLPSPGRPVRRRTGRVAGRARSCAATRHHGPRVPNSGVWSPSGGRRGTAARNLARVPRAAGVNGGSAHTPPGLGQQREVLFAVHSLVQGLQVCSWSVRQVLLDPPWSRTDPAQHMPALQSMFGRGTGRGTTSRPLTALVTTGRPPQFECGGGDDQSCSAARLDQERLWTSGYDAPPVLQRRKACGPIIVDADPVEPPTPWLVDEPASPASPLRIWPEPLRLGAGESWLGDPLSVLQAARVLQPRGR